MTSRGLRDNNPGNVRKGPITWQGQLDDQSGDPDFVTFKTPQWGIRAIARLMLTYQNQYHLSTVREIINRWAPPSENNTSAYVSAVAEGLKDQTGGIPLPDMEINVDSADIMLPLVKAIILHENGSNPYPDSLILEALHMAGVADAKPKPLAKQTSFQARIGTGAAVVVAGGAQAAQYAPVVKGWADKLSEYTGSPIIQHVVTIFITVAGGLVLIGIISDMLKQRSA